MPAPTITGRTQTQQAPQKGTPVPVIPFTRASRKKTRLAGQFGPITLNAGTQALAPIQLPAAGYARSVVLTVTGTTTGNAAAVAFNADGPFNLLQQISLLSANGDSIISPIDGFLLYAFNKYGCFSTGTNDLVKDPGFSLTPGAGANGGSFSFNIRIPFEVDSRDGFGSLANMAANQSFLLNLSLNSVGGLYTVAPTNAPQVTITAVMEYWNAPAEVNGQGFPQATFPPGNGSVSLLQTQTPPITPSTQQNIQLLNVGNTVRSVLFILRNAAGVRTETDFPNVSNIYVNNDSWYYKTKNQWRSQIARDYGLTAPTASPTAGAMDNGVFVLDDFINDGAHGAGEANAASNRNLWLVTNSATAFNFEAVSWGAGAASLLVAQNNIRPSSPEAMYTPNWI